MRFTRRLFQAVLPAVVLCILAVGAVSAHTANASSHLIQHDVHTGTRAMHPDDATVYIWATQVNVHSCPSTGCPVIAQLSQQYVLDHCQGEHELVSAEGYTNDWWSNVYTSNGWGWVSNIYVKGPAVIPGVPGGC